VDKKKVLLFSTLPDSASWQFYSNLFRINISELPLDFVQVNHIEKVYEINPSVLIVFGSGTDLALIRKKSPNIVIGLLEPRAAQKHTDEYDFIIVNSLESYDYFSTHNKPMFVYPTYPLVNKGGCVEHKKKQIVIGYHGNKIHLQAMEKLIVEAMNDLSDYVDYEFWAMYNIAELREWKGASKLKAKVRHIQFSYENYAAFISNVDIGIIPQFIPVKDSKLFRWLMGSFRSRYNERHDNYFHRFKETTNNGRAFIFAQYGIPIVADMTPSSCALIGENEYGFVASSRSGWFNALILLARDSNLRINMGRKLERRYVELWSPRKMNLLLADFILKIFKKTPILARKSKIF
jgi:hypothetical protein